MGLLNDKNSQEDALTANMTTADCLSAVFSQATHIVIVLSPAYRHAVESAADNNNSHVICTRFYRLTSATAKNYPPGTFTSCYKRSTCRMHASTEERAAYASSSTTTLHVHRPECSAILCISPGHNNRSVSSALCLANKHFIGNAWTQCASRRAA